MNIPARPWSKNKPPRRILAIRLQAMGDLAAALPYLQDLRDSFPPSVKIDLLTREEVEDIPRNILLFNKVFSIGGGRNFKKQLASTFLLLPKLFIQRYDVIIDLQNNLVSKIVRKSLLPKAWSVFDRFSPIAGGERYRLTIEAAGIGKIKAANRFHLKNPASGVAILKKNGWEEQNDLVVLNPAAAFETRNWNIHNYVVFAKLWLSEFPRTQFLVIGTSFIASKADFLKEQLGEKLISLVNKTTPSEAFAVLQQVKFVLSEDSGLMHMAWGSGVPTLGLFGSTRTDWVRPLGEHTFFLDSSDLPCGACMQETCRFGDVHCLTRYTPEKVIHHAFSLLQRLEKIKKNIYQ
ncbi:MAG: glycosyltransferase family 9 protein [Bacteroidota bacterium]|nr:glycosyltransferase family 9 protein [Bacteroidota bacterium]